ncbi:putative glutathione S-transferase [Aspergillus heteromorphus CBS 117.55]|uniref:glutathione transferase n=1 Tax=Aspergillus heteromorphus CBS 117.55 TaxID=1448321 RepID=A0A317WUC1_9EURO|nr:putative glutathione S-transferase [Aspergillus heteromorphus CBS 117.55]PWY90023.1 putative glutathione S-transferase [Aspergillus heteromorphus CBS 117.55]
MLIVHHLQRSQSDRIVWLCEELGLNYELRTYKRSPFLSPPELQALHPTKAAPIIQDGAITLGESGAITEYILTKYGDGRLSIAATAPNYADYLYFLHFANGYFQPALMRYGLVLKAGISDEVLNAKLARRGMQQSLQILEDRLRGNTWLAGEEFTAADVMVVTTLTTMRLFVPYSLQGYEAIMAYLGRVVEREAYRRALEKGDPGLEPVVGGGGGEGLCI